MLYPVLFPPPLPYYLTGDLSDDTTTENKFCLQQRLTMSLRLHKLELAEPRTSVEPQLVLSSKQTDVKRLKKKSVQL